MSHQSLSLEAIVLKRINYGEADRFVTIFSREKGKVVALAKGIRKLTSKKRAYLEPLNHVNCQLVQTKGTPLITEVGLKTSHSHFKHHLHRLTQAIQVLELIDRLTVEREVHTEIFDHLCHLLDNLETTGNHKTELIIFTCFILEELGFGIPSEINEITLKTHLEEIIEKPLRSKMFLSSR